MSETKQRFIRLHESWLAQREKRLLIWLADRVSSDVDSDRLTALGLVGAIMVGTGFVLSWLSPIFLPLACLGLFLNWLGDSLDGTLARTRGMERKRYGFFIDHAVDVAAQVFIFIGLGASPLMRMDTACLLLLSYWLATLLTLIRTVATGVFKVSYYGIGPTEIRIALLLYTLADMIVGPLQWATSLGPVSLIDAASVPIFLSVFSMFLLLSWTESRRLSTEDAPEPRAL